MHRLIAAIAIVISTFIAPTSVQAQTEPLQAKSLAGNWTISIPVTNGPNMVTTLAVGADRKFSGIAKAGDKVVWEYSGSWELKDRLLTWHYEKSSQILPESAKTDVDEVVSVNAKELVLASKADGKKNVFTRVKE